jgi:hypothetical protein
MERAELYFYFYFPFWAFVTYSRSNFTFTFHCLQIGFADRQLFRWEIRISFRQQMAFTQSFSITAPPQAQSLWSVSSIISYWHLLSHSQSLLLHRLNQCEVHLLYYRTDIYSVILNHWSSTGSINVKCIFYIIVLTFTQSFSITGPPQAQSLWTVTSIISYWHLLSHSQSLLLHRLNQCEEYLLKYRTDIYSTILNHCFSTGSTIVKSTFYSIVLTFIQPFSITAPPQAQSLWRVPFKVSYWHLLNHSQSLLFHRLNHCEEYLL